MQFELYIEHLEPDVAIDCHCREYEDSNNMQSHALVTSGKPLPSLGQKKAQITHPFRTPR